MLNIYMTKGQQQPICTWIKRNIIEYVRGSVIQ